MKLHCGCCLSSPGHIITTEKIVESAKRALQSPLHLNCCQTNRGAMTGPFLLTHLFLFLLGFSPQSQKRGCSGFFYSVRLSCSMPLLVIILEPLPLNNQFCYALQRAELPATMITACTFFRYLFLKAVVRAQTKSMCVHQDTCHNTRRPL